MKSKKHLKQLELKLIYIVREAMIVFQNPAVLYSIVKGNLVIFYLLQKTFYCSVKK